MSDDTNAFAQPVGPVVVDWSPPPWPRRQPMIGRLCALESLDPARHGQDLHTANSADDGRMWTYLPHGPFADAAAYHDWLEGFAADDTLVPFAIIDREHGRPVGVAAYLRVTPDAGSIEVGHLAFSPALQETTMATEAMALMMAHVFDDLGYRRYEWKCDALNGPSRRAADRLGFSFEGIFRQAMVVKDRSRDTAWFSIVDREWPHIRDGFGQWLDPANFDADGRQHRRLSTLTRPAQLQQS